jgi:hypothetical protein
VVAGSEAEPVVRRPITAPAAPELPARADESEGYLADALFQQVVSAKTAEPPLVAADARPGPAAPPVVPNNLDVPAFLRRRRSLRDLQEGS